MFSPSSEFSRILQARQLASRKMQQTFGRIPTGALAWISENNAKYPRDYGFFHYS
jgi:hypothetical protein